MPADLSHFSCEKRGGEQRCGCATLVPKAREKQWWKFMALSFQAGNTAGVNSNPWWWNRSVHSSSGADFHGKVVVFLHIHIYSMATQKIGTQLHRFSYKEAQTPEQLWCRTCFWDLLSLFPSLFHPERVPRCQISSEVLQTTPNPGIHYPLTHFFTQQYFDQFNHLHGECGSLGSYLAY